MGGGKMPQVLMMLSPKAQLELGDVRIDDLGRALIDDVEMIYGLKGKNDVAFAALNLRHIINEADVQVEVRYTAGKDEYGQGEPFDPPEEKKQELVYQLARTLRKKLILTTASVWIIPIKESLFSVVKRL